MGVGGGGGSRGRAGSQLTAGLAWGGGGLQKGPDPDGEQIDECIFSVFGVDGYHMKCIW